MTIFPLDDIEDLLVRQEIEQIITDTKLIADRLEDVWRYLDDTSGSLSLPNDRAAANRISQAARDFVLATRQS